MNFPPQRLRGDSPFVCGLGLITAAYALLVLLLIVANLHLVRWRDFANALADPHIQASIRLTLLSCSFSALLAVLAAVPIGYLLARYRFPGRALLDALLDLPIFLPPLVVGTSLLLLFNHLPLGGTTIESWLRARGIGVTFTVAAVVLAQFVVATAFAIRLIKTTFDQLDPRCEHLATTLGCNRHQAFWRIALPLAARGIAAATVLAWARALGEFGPILVFAGATRGRTEVLATSIFLELNLNNLSGAAAISLLMMALAIALIFLMRRTLP